MVTASKRTILSATLAATLGIALVGCSGGGSTESSDFTFWGLNAAVPPVTTLEQLQSDVCTEEVADAPLVTDNSAEDQYDQKVQLAAGQDALPGAFVTPSSNELTKQLIDSGRLVNISEVLDEEGLTDEILPAAASTIRAIYGTDDLYALPHELNIEGIWYNKAIFEEQGIEIPGTWDELVDVAAQLQAAGIQPITAAGKDGWPVSRYVGNYIMRSLGSDAMAKVADGSAKLTDPEYVEAAEQVAALGASGAFGPNVASNDYNGALNDFLSGNAAMYYMGSWVIAAFNDPAQNAIGVENIGYMPFPAVEGGAGSITEVPANVGKPMVFGQDAFNDGARAWLLCIVQNYGDQALGQDGVVSGFAIHEEHEVAPLTQLVQDQLGTAESSVLWFEALFNSKANTLAGTNAGLLVSGGMSGADYMKALQDALDE